MRTLPQIIDHLAAAHPDRPALVGNDRTDTFAALADESRRAAGWLRDQGLRAGDRLVLATGQHNKAAILHIAAARIGALIAPVSRTFAGPAREARIGAVSPGLVIDDEALDHADWSRSQPPSLEVQASAEAAAWLVPTSGTTGAPRVVVLPHRVLDGRMAGFRAVHGDGPGRFFSPADWAWIGGFLDALWAPLTAGMTVVLWQQPRLDAAALWRQLGDGIDHAFLPPAALRALRGLGVKGDAPARTLHTAGEPLHPADAAWARSHIAPRVETVYGLTESAFLCHGAAIEQIGDVGTPSPGQHLDIGPDGIRVAADSPTLMLGYWNGPDAAPSLPLQDGWFLTGDVAEETERGLRITGRRDDLVQIHGIRVSPMEVESSLLEHADVRDAGVAALPDLDGRPRLVAFVVCDAPGPRTALALRRHVADSLAPHARPAEVRFVERLPRTASGKLLRRSLQDLPSA